MTKSEKKKEEIQESMVPLTARSNGGPGSDAPENMDYVQSDIGPSGFTLVSSSISSARTIR